MYAIAINGSPRNGGNTETLLKTVTKGLENNGWETEYIRIGGKAFRGCMACGSCFKTKNMQCALGADGFNDIFEKMAKADAVLIGSPTYFADVTAETKGLLDRMGYVSMANGNVLKGKVGTAVVAVRRGGAIHAFDTINHTFHLSRMLVPGSTYWNFAFGRGKGEVSEDAEGIANMAHLAEVIDWLAKAVKPVMDSYPETGKACAE
ncbi:MAG: flavodoxin family protein [Deferribacterales bacterium]